MAMRPDCTRASIGVIAGHPHRSRPDMTEIDVPDWVVARARAAVREFWENYKGGHDCGEFDAAMKAALTAALGAWVVPVPQFGDASSDSEWFDGVLTNIDPDDTFYKTRTLYTLRQEKPE